MSEILSPPIHQKLPELDVALEAATKAGKAIMEIYSKDFSVYTKKDNSPLTEADLKSNKIIKEFLFKTQHAILSEEDKDDISRLDENIIWIIDPLDGTLDFVNRTGEFTVMIALVKEKKPILGIIFWPIKNILYVAQKGAGAFCFSNNSWGKISVSKIRDITKCRAVGSRHHLSDIEKTLLKKLGITEFTSIGSSLKVGKVSSGEAEVYFSTTNKMKEWDSSASYCIVTEAGGKMTDMLGNELTYNNKIVNHNNGILVTNGSFHDTILEEYKKLQ